MKSAPTLAMVIAALLTGEIRAGEKPVKIYVFAGQSNMEARYGRDFLAKDHPELLTDRSAWHVQVGWPSGPVQDCPTFGVDRAMVYKLAEATAQEIIVFRSATGGTILQTDWRPPSAVKRAGGTIGPLYLNLVNRFHNLVAHLKEVYPAYHGQGYEIAGFIWFQGESDCCSQTEVEGVKTGNWNYYEGNLRDLIKDVRQDFGVPELPVLIAQINVSDPWELSKETITDAEGNRKQTTAGQIVRDVQKKVAESTPNCVWVETLGLSRGYHYDAPSYIEIGRRMAEAMMPLAKKTTVASDAAMLKARQSFRDRVFPDLKPDATSLARGLIACFTFDEGAGLNVTDSSSRKLKGELVSTQDGKYVPQWTAGVRGTALKFMASDHVRVPDYVDPATPDGTIDRISMSYWINKTGHCGYGGHLARRSAGNKRGWWIDEWANTNYLWIHLLTGEGEYDERADGSEPRTIGDGYEWHHIAVVFDGPGRRFDYYFDGGKLSRKTTVIQADGEKKVVVKRPAAWQILSAGEDVPLLIGQQGWFGAMQGPFEAQSIDEVAIWDRALTETEITALYNNGRGVTIPVK